MEEEVKDEPSREDKVNISEGNVKVNALDKWFGTAGKPRIVSAAVLVMLLIIICFIIYTATYTIPVGAVEKTCKEYMIANCELTGQVNMLCLQIALEEEKDIDISDYV